MPPNDMEQVWKDLKKKDEITHCEICGRKIWKFWRVADNYYKTKKFQEMKRCGPCY